MNQESKELWETILYKYIRGYKDLKNRGVKITSVVNYNNRLYIIEMKNKVDEIYKVELYDNVIQHFLNTFKTSYSEMIIDENCNFKQVITDYELYKIHLKQLEYAKQQLSEMACTFGNSQKIDRDWNN
jgi:hypothetical protein